VAFYVSGGIGIKISCVDVGLVGRVVRVRSEIVKKILEGTFVRANSYTSQVECILLEEGRQRPLACNCLVQGG